MKVLSVLLGRRGQEESEPSAPVMNTRLPEFEAAALQRASGKQRRKIEGGDASLLAKLVEEIKAERIFNYRQLHEQRVHLLTLKNQALDSAKFWESIPRSMGGGHGTYRAYFLSACTHQDQIDNIDLLLNP